ncbi:MAG: ribonuclease Z [Candidatus Lokiarchaeota archaeon]|nr:ribonuclease Z [Candidatus Harpocratesius repetitus]
MELIFLGTSGATPTKERNLPSVALRLDSGHILLFDAGEDVQRRFEAANLKFNVPSTIFISHLHGDHVIGLPGLLFNFHLNSRTKPLTIVGPLGIASFLLMHYQIVGLKAQNYPLTVIEIVPPRLNNSNFKNSTNNVENHQKNQISQNTQIIVYSRFLTPEYERKFLTKEDNIIFSAKKYHVKHYWLNHSVPTMGFRFEEHPLNGKFNPIQAKKIGVPEGKLWKRLQNGQSITLKDGRIINPVESGIVTPPRPGRIICYGADTAKCDSLVKLAENADIFICESTFGKELQDIAIEKKHLTAEMAAEIAKKARVQMLFLTHFSSRYKDVKDLLIEAKQIFPSTQTAKDLLSVNIKVRNQKKN